MVWLKLPPPINNQPWHEDIRAVTRPFMSKPLSNPNYKPHYRSFTSIKSLLIWGEYFFLDREEQSSNSTYISCMIGLCNMSGFLKSHFVQKLHQKRFVFLLDSSNEALIHTCQAHYLASSVPYNDSYTFLLFLELWKKKVYIKGQNLKNRSEYIDLKLQK